MSTKLMDYFNKQPRLGALATSNSEGKVNIAYFGSPRMIDEKTIVVGLGKNRTFDYLQENPNAVYMIMEPGKSAPEWKGVRLYLTMTGCAISGEKLDSFRANLAKIVGEAASKMIHAVVTFQIGEIRPLADFGQGWEKSISP